MAADTAPAAVPDPNHAPSSAANPAAEPGLWASLLAPVEPARPAVFTIDPATAEGPATQDLTGATSAAFHGDENTPEKTANSTGQTRQKESVVRAWLLAGAKRWEKGAGANIKRLEVQKARAMAQQVKETRTLNRTEKNESKSAPVSSSGSSAAGGGASKGPAKKQDSDADRGPKNTSAPRGSGSGGADRTKMPAPAPAGPKPAPSPKPAPAPKTPKTPKDSAPGKAGASGPSGASGTSGGSKRESAGEKKSADGRSGKDRGRTGGGNTSPGKGGASSSAKDYVKGWKTPADEDDDKPTKRAPEKTSGRGAVSLLKRKGSTAGGDRDTSARKDIGPAATDTSSTKRPAEPAAKKPEDTKPEHDKKPTADAGKKTDPKTPDTPAKPSDTKPTGKDTPKTAGPQPDKPLRTRESRETGYRDGARAGRAASQVKAYRDGFKDGWTDTQDTAAEEKTRLDQAHELRKQQRDKDTAVPRTQAAPPKPTRAPAVPIPVTGIVADNVHLGDGANRSTLARGEVRTLKRFERRLEDKQRVMQTIAEQTKGLEAHAAKQADEVLQLLEQAKAVKGGGKLVAALTKLHDDAKVQAAAATEIHARAVRGADASGAVLTNVQIRYGGIYKAVVDSDEIKPAEMQFYKG